MRIAHIEIRHFRGIRKLNWTPSPGMNCLIGPGDSTKTTILDAIELALNPRANYIGNDVDFYNLDYSAPATIVITLLDLPQNFYADDRYGLHLRGWDQVVNKIIDEPGEPADGVVDALSVRLQIDPDTLEGQWSIFNDRLSSDTDPPSLRFKDARELATSRLGPYADRHFSWGRQSILNRIGENAKMHEQLANANRAARDAFRSSNKDIFAIPTARAESLSKLFSVPVRAAFSAELDLQSSAVNSGGVALHDGDLPLRTLGTGSSRLIVSALQHTAQGSHIALVDEIEHGLEPHRIARLLKYLLTAPATNSDTGVTDASPQIFLSTHSEVVIRELRAHDIHAVRCHDGETKVKSVALAADTVDAAQRYLRSAPEAFLAKRILVGEGRTECGILRGLDACWVRDGSDSFALRGVVAIDGRGIPEAVSVTQHLLNLGYECLALLDSDESPSPESIAKVESVGGIILQWPGNCSTEERIFLDVPWDVVQALVAYAAECNTADSVLARANALCRLQQIPELTDLALPDTLDSIELRSLLGKTAKAKKNAWFKTIERGEHVATIIYPSLYQIAEKPLAQHLRRARAWIDG